MVRSSDSSLEAIRESLRQRGYLNTRIDRLILRGAGARRGWLWGAVKAGLLSGSFLGLLLLAALLLTHRPRLTFPWETFVLGLYLMALATTVMIAIQFGGSLLARLLSKWPGDPRFDAVRIARWVGSVGALLAGAYLFFWWRQRGSEVWGAAVQILAGLAILGLSLGIGRITSVNALLSLIRPGRIPAARKRERGRGLVLAGLIVLLGLVIAIPWTRGGSPRLNSPPPTIDSRPRPGRVLWVGIDGLGEQLFDELAREGRLSFLARTAQEGCRVSLRRPNVEPPAIWVSAATGFDSTRHGVSAVQAATLRGVRTPVSDGTWTTPLLRAARWMTPSLSPVKPVPVSGAFRRDKTVWEVLADQSIPSFVVNWWTTWPAEEGPGVRISERAFFKLEAGGIHDREVFPPEEFEQLRRDFPKFLSDASQKEGEEPGNRSRVNLPFLMDAYHMQQATRGWEQGRWPLVAVYLNGGDLLAGRLGEAASRTDSLRAARRAVEHLVFLDGSLETLASALDEQDWLVVQGDPGRVGGPDGSRGLLLLRGTGIQARRTTGSLLDVAPTLLHLLGFPRSEEMPGSPLAPCFEPGHPLAQPVGPPVASYGDRQPPEMPVSEFDAELLERLRSLGYIR